ncbi:MAG TPA: vitamin B12-dependent ribonucleotide reductase [Kiritimatiellae bacterium]|nr:vitamin B12-dependent ribonucleotide reductase [Kiritimatiellia bacterium]
MGGSLSGCSIVRGDDGKALRFRRLFSSAGCSPFDTVKWVRRRARIADDKGKVIFEQDGVEVPEFWSQLATNIVASKYLYGEIGTPQREHSLRRLIHRVARTIADWGLKDGCFATAEDAGIFYDELAYLCLHQYGAFNSPVWFNCGLYQQYGVGADNKPGSYYFDKKDRQIRQAATQYEHPQCSACFIQSVEDTMESIMELARSEAMLFKFGSGTGTDLSTLRSCRERLSGGGRPSGPLSFLRVYDAIASVIKSGGKTRRAAKMNSLQCWHPDIRDFISAKAEEERKARALIAEGYDADFNGPAYTTVAFQNENLSVRVSDEFMQAVLEDREWQTHWVTDPGTPGPKYRARDLMRWIAEGTWTCGDPGLQYDDTINRWHTCKSSGRINASNPCSEYMFLDNSACNLASLNLLRFLDAEGTFDLRRFVHAVEIFVTAQEIIVDNASYPTPKIALNSHLFRPLGLGYANLGALIMTLGLPYDSQGGRSLAAGITALMHFAAYRHSARMAEALGAFPEFSRNRQPMLEVIRMHREALDDIPEGCPQEILRAAGGLAAEALEAGIRSGYRNAQVTLLAPTGTIGFMMDCDTTGIEPDIALVKYKQLAGGGMLKIVNQSVSAALRRLGYSEEEVSRILDYVDQNDTIEGAPGLKKEHLPVFDCAFKPAKGTRFIPYMAHIRMMAAVQPFLSGAISKTVNMPSSATVEEITQAYIEGWKLGLKALAIYRDGCKQSQPVVTAESNDHGQTRQLPSQSATSPRPFRRRMPPTRRSLTHKFSVGGHEGYLTVGLYEDGSPGELFITMAKEGSTIGGLMDSLGTCVSLCLQYGVPLHALVDKFAHTRFEPSGFTSNPNIPIASSLTDYIFRWLGHTFLKDYPDETTGKSPEGREAEEWARKTTATPPAARQAGKETPGKPGTGQVPVTATITDAPICDVCGSITIPNGFCYRCPNCGHSIGCS